MLVKVSDFQMFLHRIMEEKIGNFSDLFVPTRSPAMENGQTSLTDPDRKRDIVLDTFRPIDPVKIVFYRSREQVSETEYKQTERLLAGVKSCDLKALNILDKALINDDFIDPAYKHWRNHTTIIASDCTAISENCHCNLLGGKPYPESGFDINLSRIDDAYYLSIGSEKGHAFADLIKKTIPFTQNNINAESIIDSNRKIIYEQLVHQNSGFSYSPRTLSLKQAEPEVWSFESPDCIGCGACTNICPTCYCLILNDEGHNKKFIKVRSYDSCQLNGYARVAGGGTPRPKMSDRFRNRYLCKFDYMQSNFDEPGCTGCGRCIETCPATIDFRQVIDAASNHKEVQREPVSSGSEVEVEA